MTAAIRRLPMFPLGRAALPGEGVPLRIFEPRYLAMMGDVLAGDGEFGVVLISRGWEVGGGEERTEIGSVAVVVQTAELPEDQLVVVAVAQRRLRVVEWLPDDPYPNALVTEVEDPAEEDQRSEAIDELARRMRRVYALASELGADVADQDLTLPEAPGAAVWRLCSLLPVGQHDRQRLLEASDLGFRIALLDEMIADANEELTLRLAEG